MGSRERRVDYPTAVVATLAGEFPSLTDPSTADIVREAVARHHRQPRSMFECIVDHPTLSNWRLVPNRDVPGRVRLACFRLQSSVAEQDREQRVNEALDSLAT